MRVRQGIRDQLGPLLRDVQTTVLDPGGSPRGLAESYRTLVADLGNVALDDVG